MVDKFQVMNGLAPSQMTAAGRLFWSAFAGKLGFVMGPEDRALRFLNGVVESEFAISALSSDGRLIGVAGFKTADGAFVGGELSDLQAVYGFWGGLWRGVLLSVLERPLEDDVLLMDGIFVDEGARGQGVGSALLAAIKAKAIELGCREVRLDVIDSNPRARALYERQGFEARGTSSTGVFRHVFGFRCAMTMVWSAAPSR